MRSTLTSEDKLKSFCGKAELAYDYPQNNAVKLFIRGGLFNGNKIEKMTFS